MPLECINPHDLPIPEMYSQVVVATGSKLVFVSGQQPEDIHGKLVGHGDFAAQARLAFGNLGRALAAAGARPEEVCKITIYIVDYKRDEHVPIIEQAQIELFGDHKPANVVVGIAVMSPGYLIEIDAIAVVGSARTSQAANQSGTLISRPRSGRSTLSMKFGAISEICRPSQLISEGSGTQVVGPSGCKLRR